MRYIYQLINGRRHYWTTCGWSPSISAARRYRSYSDAEGPLRRMMLDNVKAKVTTSAQ